MGSNSTVLIPKQNYCHPRKRDDDFDEMGQNSNCDQVNKRIKLQVENEMDKSGKMISSALNPLQMEDTLYNLFLYMNVDSLKNCRQVCKIWENEASKQMFKIGYFKIPQKLYSHDKENKGVDRKVVQETETRAISSFLQSKCIKIQNIFLNSSSIEDIEILQTLKLKYNNNCTFGTKSQVKELKLDFNWISNYEKLILEEFQNVPTLTHHFPPSAFGGYYGNHPAYRADLLDTFISMSKKLKQPLTISHLPFLAVEFRNERLFNIFEEFSKSQIKIKSLLLDLDYSPNATSPRTQQQLNSILSTSQDTLEEIIFYEPLGFLTHLKMPELKNVKSLIVHVLMGNLNVLPNGLFTNFYYGGFLLPPNFTFIKNLPGLEYVQLLILDNNQNRPGLTNLSDDDDNFFLFDLWSKSFDKTGIAPQVKIVDITDEFGFDKKSLERTFPNAIIRYQGKRIMYIK